MMEQQNNIKVSVDGNPDPSKSSYSVDMIDTMFADSLSRGMQNAIISQQNAQMASSASITSACARILQAASEQPAATENAEADTPSEKNESEEEEGETESDTKSDLEVIVATKEDVQAKVTVTEVSKSIKDKWHWIVWSLIALMFLGSVAYFHSELKAISKFVEQEVNKEAAHHSEQKTEPEN